MDDKKFLISLGEEIASLRKKKNLTQLDLSVEIGVDKQSITRIEKGHTNPTSLTLLKISKALDVPVSKLFSFQKKVIVKKN
jgi:transcriptional regulator with XRE-family HTH domain